MAKDSLRRNEIPEAERAFYSAATSDIEYKYPFTTPGFGELEGVAYRTDYDLTQHQTHSKVNLEYIDQENGNKRYLPHVVEPAAGLTRGVLALLCEAYKYDENRPSPEWLKLKPSIAPVKLGIFPLVNKEGMPEVGEKLYLDLRKDYMCQYDAKQSIGKRYARMDEAGTPFCVTVDGNTLKDQTVTVRDRDTAQQERVAIGKVREYVGEEAGGMKSIGTWAYQCAAISASMRVGQCEIIARGLVVARRQNADGARPEELGTKLRARYRCGLKQIGSLRLAGERFARAPLWAARVLILSPPLRRSASRIATDFKRSSLFFGFYSLPTVGAGPARVCLGA